MAIKGGNSVPRPATHQQPSGHKPLNGGAKGGSTTGGGSKGFGGGQTGGHPPKNY